MKVIRIQLMMYGDDFLPRTFIKETSTQYKIVDINDKEDIIDSGCKQGQRYEYGFIYIEHPNLIGIDSEWYSYCQWYIDFLKLHKDIIAKSKIDEINLWFDVFFYGQCNFEIFDKEMLSDISTLKVSFPVSIYPQSKKQIIELLEDYYSKEEIKQIFKNE